MQGHPDQGGLEPRWASDLPLPRAEQVANHFDLKSGRIHQAADPLVKPSDWILLARNNSVLGRAEVASKLKPLRSRRSVRLWTDDYSNLFQILK